MKEAGWWVTEETAHCGFCAHGYSWDMAVHCVDCDEPVCPLCVVYVERRVCRCPECREAAEGAA